MSIVRTLSGVTPDARFDGQAWTSYAIQEAANEAGPWVSITANSIATPDADPSQPVARNFTTPLATINPGYYRVQFVDPNANFCYSHVFYLDTDDTSAAAADPSLVQQLRDLVAAGASEYSVGGVEYWTDVQLLNRIQGNRTYISGGEIDWIMEPAIGGGGSFVYKRGKLNVPGLIEASQATGGTAPDWTMMTAYGVVPSGTVTIQNDGHVTFSANQSSVQLAFYGFCYDLYAAAADVLDAWASHLMTGYDFQTDQQNFNRSQAYEQVSDRAREMRRSQAPSSAILNVYEDAPGFRRQGAMTANQRRTWGA